jgi:Mn2+/Fe2+ NRAMP family transporter
MKTWLAIALGIVTATGGFLDAGTVATAGEAGARFGLGLVWVIVIATLAITLLTEMSGRFTAVSKKPYASAIREHFGFKFFLLPLVSEIIAEGLLLAAELGGIAIALSLITGISWHILFFVAALLVWVLAWRAPFDLIENGPAVLGLVALSFVGGVVALRGPVPSLLPTLWRPEIPHGELATYLYLAAAIMGATISPYILFFYSSGAHEEGWSRGSLGVNRVTAIVGMGFGCVSMIALVILAAVYLKPLGITADTLGEIGLPMAAAFGSVGGLLFAATLFATCLGASLEVLLAVSYMIAQGFGWEWGENKKPVQAARFNVTILVFLAIAVVVGALVVDPLQLALFASTTIALFLPFSLLPILVIMNDPLYLQDQTNHWFSNIATLAVLLLAFVVAIVSLPLVFLSGGG